MSDKSAIEIEGRLFRLGHYLCIAGFPCQFECDLEILLHLVLCQNSALLK